MHLTSLWAKAWHIAAAEHTSEQQSTNNGVGMLNWMEPAPMWYQVYVLMYRGLKQLASKELTVKATCMSTLHHLTPAAMSEQTLNFALNGGLALLFGLIWCRT